jgi:hypothetical protein
LLAPAWLSVEAAVAVLMTLFIRPPLHVAAVRAQDFAWWLAIFVAVFGIGVFRVIDSRHAVPQ